MILKLISEYYLMEDLSDLDLEDLKVVHWSNKIRSTTGFHPRSKLSPRSIFGLQID